VAWLLFAVWAAASIAWSVRAGALAEGMAERVFYTTLALLVCYIGAQAQDAARAFMVTLSTGAVLACASALWAFASGLPPESSTGWHGGPGDHSAALLTLMPCARRASGTRGRPAGRAQPCGAGALLVVLFSLRRTRRKNRTVWLGFALEIAVFVVALRSAQATGGAALDCGRRCGGGRRNRHRRDVVQGEREKRSIASRLRGRS